MIHTLIISNDLESADLIGRLARLSEQVAIDRMFYPAPQHHELAHALNTLPLDVVLLDISRHEDAVHLLEQIRRRAPLLPVVGFCTVERYIPAPSPTTFSLSLPLSTRGLMDTVRRAIRRSRPDGYSNVVAILPAKAGSGASTIAMNVAAQLASHYGKRVAVAEADARSGTIADCLGLHPQQAIGETLHLADVAETLIWPRHVAQKSGIDFLVSNRDRGVPEAEWHNYHHLLAFLNRRYDVVITDLPETSGDANLEILNAAGRVYIATTPEYLSLTLARQRIRELADAQVDPSRVRILINRWHSRDLKPKEVADLLGCPVEAQFPNDYPAVNAAITERTFVDPKTRLGNSYRAFAGSLSGADAVDPERTSSFLGSLKTSILRSSTAA